MNSLCPCGSKLNYSVCCEPFHLNQSYPDTAEKLMRSRYSAYVKHLIDYIEVTNEPNERESFDRESTEAWAKDSKWMGLEIIATRDGKKGDTQGEVEFKARFQRDGNEVIHHEVSLFHFSFPNQRWYYADGKEIREPIRVENKTGRNDPCSCGSGKKFKKCCG